MHEAISHGRAGSRAYRHSLRRAQTATSGQQRVPVTVFAPASLNDVFTKLEPQFEAANPGADLRFNFGGSSDLAQQIVNGAPADVFASANEAQMNVVQNAGKVAGTPQPFVTNVLTIVVPPATRRTFTPSPMWPSRMSPRWCVPLRCRAVPLP